jgi:hypothetical protein
MSQRYSKVAVANEQILAEHQAKGLEEQALEADVAKKTKAAKRRAAKRGAAPGSATAETASSREKATPVANERPKRGLSRIHSVGNMS